MTFLQQNTTARVRHVQKSRDCTVTTFCWSSAMSCHLSPPSHQGRALPLCGGSTTRPRSENQKYSQNSQKKHLPVVGSRIRHQISTSHMCFRADGYISVSERPQTRDFHRNRHPKMPIFGACGAQNRHRPYGRVLVGAADHNPPPNFQSKFP